MLNCLVLAKGYTLKEGTVEQGLHEFVHFVQYALQTLLYRNSMMGAEKFCGPTIEIALRKHSSDEDEKLRDILYSFTLAAGLVYSSEGIQTCLHILHKNVELSELARVLKGVSNAIRDTLGPPTANNSLHELGARIAVGKLDFDVQEKEIYDCLWTECEWV
jgi:hypothetical protein